MWMITNFGFFSVVQKKGDKKSGTLTVRARVRGDLEELRDRYLPNMGPIESNKGTDYKFRVRVPRSDLGIAVLQIVMDLDYDNFKNAVAVKQGHEREEVYHKVWDVLYALQKTAGKEKRGKAVKSYGGVLVDDKGRVLLRKPTNEFDGYVWTFPKGLGEERETVEETALREVREEIGYDAEIVAKIPGSFTGGTRESEYFLMRPLGSPSGLDLRETEAIEWVSWEDAPGYINQTRNPVGRKRDLQVLAAARKVDERTSKRGV